MMRDITNTVPYELKSASVITGFLITRFYGFDVKSEKGHLGLSLIWNTSALLFLYPSGISSKYCLMKNSQFIYWGNIALIIL